MSNATSNAAAIYALADSLVQLRFRAEVAWCSEEEGDGVTARVDAEVGRALQRLEEVLSSDQNAERRALGENLRDAVATAWDDYKRAWMGSQRRQALEWWRKTLTENDYEKRSYAISKSPLAAHSWQELERLTVEFRATLPGDHRTCFDLSSMLAEELYPTEQRERRVEHLGISELRYLTVELNRQVKQAVSALSVTFAGLRNLSHDLSELSEYEAMSQIALLHRSIQSCLDRETAAPTSEPPLHRPPNQPAVVTATSPVPAAFPREEKPFPPSHSADFRSVHWFGEQYSFTTKQASCVEILWKHWQQKTPDVSGSYILNELNFNGDRLDHIFRNNIAWHTMIVPGKTKGTYRLNPPDDI